MYQVERRLASAKETLVCLRDMQAGAANSTTCHFILFLFQPTATGFDCHTGICLVLWSKSSVYGFGSAEALSIVVLAIQALGWLMHM